MCICTKMSYWPFKLVLLYGELLGGWVEGGGRAGIGPTEECV